VSSIQTGANLATGNWQLATGNWQLATGNWQLATGNWQLATPYENGNALDIVFALCHNTWRRNGFGILPPCFDNVSAAAQLCMPFR